MILIPVPQFPLSSFAVTLPLPLVKTDASATSSRLALPKAHPTVRYGRTCANLLCLPVVPALQTEFIMHGCNPYIVNSPR